MPGFSGSKGLGTMRAFLFLAVLVACAAPAVAGEFADGFLRARAVVGRYLEDPELNSAYGTPAFDAAGHQVDGIHLNFTGKGRDGQWMLYTLTLQAGGVLTGEGAPNNPRPDAWDHHLVKPLQPAAWLPPEEAVGIALKEHPEHPPVNGVSMAYAVSKDHQNRAVMTLYWQRDDYIYHTIVDARYGDVIEKGQTYFPHGN